MQPIKQITLLLVLLVQVLVLGAGSSVNDSGTGPIGEARVLPEREWSNGGPVLKVLPANDLKEELVAAQDADGLSMSVEEGPLDAPCDNDLPDLTDDLGSNPELDEFFKNTPGGVEAWKSINKSRPNLSKDQVYLKALVEVVDNLELDIHIFKGEIRITGGVPGAYSFKVSGVHHKEALDGVSVRIKDGTKTTPNSKGYYKAKVEMHHPANVNNGGWKTKAEESTFFPDSWSKQTVQEEIAFAYKNKKPLGGNKFEGIMSDGTKLIMFIDGDKIISAFPEI